VNGGGRNLAAIASLLVILGAGVGVGVGIDRLWLRPAGAADARRVHRSDRQRTAEAVGRFRQQLSLSEEQAGKVQAVLEKSRADVNAIKSRVEPEIEAVRQRSRQEVEALLSAEQKVRYRQVVMEYEARRRAKRLAHEGP
jgi:hypothetical protein